VGRARPGPAAEPLDALAVDGDDRDVARGERRPAKPEPLVDELRFDHAEEVDGVKVVVTTSEGADQRSLLDVADRLKARLGEAAVVIGGADGGRLAVVASFTQGAVERGLSAAQVVREAAEVAGGGGGGRDDVAQAGGKGDSADLERVLEAARRAVERALTN